MLIADRRTLCTAAAWTTYCMSLEAILQIFVLFTIQEQCDYLLLLSMRAALIRLLYHTMSTGALL